MSAMQYALVFPARGGVDRAALDQSAAELGVTPVDLVAADGTRLYGWYRAGAKPGACAVLYLPGNAESVAGSMALNRWITGRGCDFLTVAYRGYPGSEGHPSEDGLAADARAAWDWLIARGLTPARIAIHGRSLGGGVGVRLAGEVSPGFLALESTFTSIPDVAAHAYRWLPVRALLRHQFPSEARIRTLAVPVLITHSRDDHTIPVSHGRALAKAQPAALYIESALWDHGDELVLADKSVREAYAAGLSWLSAEERSPSPWP
jgi:fermentation-respiration switch protein FrsA (DUF1100 family)